MDRAASDRFTGTLLAAAEAAKHAPPESPPTLADVIDNIRAVRHRPPDPAPPDPRPPADVIPLRRPCRPVSTPGPEAA